MEACQDATWRELFRLAPTPCTASSTAGDIPNNFSLRFGAYKDSICGSSLGPRVGPLTPFAPAAVRAAQAAILTHRHPRLPILDEAVPAYKTALANYPEEPTPVKLPTLTSPQHSPEDMDEDTFDPCLDPTEPQTGATPEISTPPTQ